VGRIVGFGLLLGRQGEIEKKVELPAPLMGKKFGREVTEGPYGILSTLSKFKKERREGFEVNGHRDLAMSFAEQKKKRGGGGEQGELLAQYRDPRESVGGYQKGHNSESVMNARRSEAQSREG